MSEYLVASLTLGHPFSADLDPGLAEDLDHLEGVDAEGGWKENTLILDPDDSVIM